MMLSFIFAPSLRGGCIQNREVCLAKSAQLGMSACLSLRKFIFQIVVKQIFLKKRSSFKNHRLYSQVIKPLRTSQPITFNVCRDHPTSQNLKLVTNDKRSLKPTPIQRKMRPSNTCVSISCKPLNRLRNYKLTIKEFPTE